jgi:deoxyribonuclease-4
VTRPFIGAQIRTAGGLALVPQRALDIGAEVVQIFNSNARQWRTQVRQPEEISAFLEGLRHYRLPLFFHSIYLINLSTADDVLRGRSVEALADALLLAGLTGAEGVISHVGSRHHLTFPEAMARIDESVRAAYAVVRERLDAAPGTDLRATPIPNAIPRLLLETSPGSGTTVGGKLDELEALLRVLPASCGVCLDTAHLFASGYPLHTEQGLEETVAELRARDLIPRVGLVHLNDSKTPLGCSCDRHENLGEGLIGFAGLARVVRHPALREVPFVLEVPGADGKGPDAVNVNRAKSMRQGASALPEPPARPASPPEEQG